jgi:hypothetical protein
VFDLRDGRASHTAFIAITLGHFVAACSEDPACYWEEHCSNGIDAQHRFDSTYGDEDYCVIRT